MQVTRHVHFVALMIDHVIRSHCHVSHNLKSKAEMCTIKEMLITKKKERTIPLEELAQWRQKKMHEVCKRKEVPSHSLMYLV